ncbi:cereblon family protein [Desulfolutivibrio sp.]|uniref:cereblon family protein n=1 Tax=Desulfolutivibrio sp. TaxID=2773296 RepID=UPI002F96DFCB
MVRLDDAAPPRDKSRVVFSSASQQVRDANDPFILCAACRRRITTRDMAVARSGAHRHVFCNPAGMVFRLGLYRHAPGCLALEPPSTEFTWFPGHAWRVACCRGCGTHLGWRFSAVSDDAFFGIILDRVIVEPAGHL